MTRSEREALIERLQAANVDSTVEIERRQAEREADPNAMQELLLADRRVTRDENDLAFGDPADGRGSPPVSAPEPAARHDAEPSDGELMQALDRFADATTKAGAATAA